MKLSFFGAAGTVTGSRYLLENDGVRVLIDCGLFQGLKNLRLRNWAPFPAPPKHISCVVLTHAHLDHSGYLPALVRDGFKGPVYCSDATRDLCEILLPDSAHLLEQDAEYANRRGFSKHKPALPLYNATDAERALKRLSPLHFDRRRTFPEGFSLRLHRAGHIPGAAIVEIDWSGRKIIFSGDLGRYDDPTMMDPSAIMEAHYLVMESTYGDRTHERRDAEEALASIVNRTAARGGTVIIPAFAVGRAQTLLFHLERLKSSRRLVDVPIYLNSPMAIDATETLCRRADDQRLTREEWRRACSVARYVESVDESKAINEDDAPKVIISASGMATGGRVLHHLKKFAPDPRNTILFAGFQAAGTRGAALVGGAQSVKIHGEYVPVRAEVDNLSMLSAHADANELMRWLGNFRRPPRMTFLTHGEPTASDTLRLRIQDELGWRCHVPEMMETSILE
ncbi:MBL fold metallo-hydrolase RNA specificity domain-containing protein [Methylocystis sp. ATCC 49242]|uniref:MBL fold metallo-hydrolase RNA specificity domain-containing protein n=1 Tax=Methylocystis sp. ATCC 49242 TaxID=622637 RepID=UPI0001F888D2|nr:MBL fold metallo-hydrolase [Methylocystis sp. ATCC 49242]